MHWGLHPNSLGAAVCVFVASGLSARGLMIPHYQARFFYFILFINRMRPICGDVLPSENS